jgi:hypothetical protein
MVALSSIDRRKDFERLNALFHDRFLTAEMMIQ